MNVGAVVVAAGRGERLGGDTPKAIRALAGKPLLLYALEAIEETPEISTAVAVVPGGYEEPVRETADRLALRKLTAIVPGGTHRQASVQRGLEALGDAIHWAAVHDAARPFVRPEMFTAVIRAAREHGGAIAAVRVTDTLKESRGERILRTLDRSQIWQAQTPQVFVRSELQDVLARCTEGGIRVTDEAEAMERFGQPVALVEVSSLNFKISTPAEWQIAFHLLHAGPGESS